MKRKEKKPGTVLKENGSTAPAPDYQLTQLDDLQPDPENPRDITPEALAGLQESLAGFGDLSGLTWNRRTGQLVAGHQRLQALKARYGAALKLDPRAGLEGSPLLSAPGGITFPVRVVDWDETRQRLANLAANNPHIAGIFTHDAQPQLAKLLAGEEKAMAALRLDLLLEREPQNPTEEYTGMPAFDLEDQTAFRTIKVHFEKQEDVEAFAKKIGQKVSEDTSYLWFPYKPPVVAEDKRYVDKSGKQA